MEFNSDNVNINGELIPEVELKDSIIRLLRNIDGSKYFKNNGYLNKNFLNKINGEFEYQRLPDRNNMQRARVTLNMNNAVTEVYVGLILAGLYDRIPDYKNNRLNGSNIYDYSRIPAVKNVLMSTYLNNIRFINSEKVRQGRGRGRRVVQVKNPVTERFINVTGRVYKNYYGNLVLKKVIYKDLTNAQTEEYEIKNNCVSSLIEYLFDKKTANKYIPEEPTYNDIIKLASEKDIRCKIYDDIGRLIDEVKSNNEENQINIRIYGNHAYLLNEKKKRGNKEVSLRNFTDIHKYNDKKFIIKDVDRYNKFIEQLKKKYIINGWNEHKLVFKRNEVHCIPDYDKIVKFREQHDIKKTDSTNIKMIINKFIKLKGIMNDETYDIFDKEITKNIIVYKKYDEDLYTVVFDSISAYMSQLYDNKLPIPNINNYIEEYDNKMRTGTFYYCEIKSNLFFKKSGWYYQPIVEEFKKRNMIKKITHQLVCSTTKVDPLYLPHKSGDKSKDNANSFDKSDIRECIGCLLMTFYSEEEKYEEVKESTVKALLDKYEEVNVNPSFFIDDSKDHKTEYDITLYKKYKKYKTGLLAWLAIVQLNNYKLFLLDEQIKKLNPNCILTRIMTDSIGYLFKDKNYKYPKDMISKTEFGKFRIEKTQDLYIKDKGKDKEIKTEMITKEPKIPKYKIKKYAKDDFKQILDEDESANVVGIGGSGKSYFIINEVLPYLRKHKKKYILCSTTIEQAADLERQVKEKVYTIQSFLNKTVHELKRIFKDIWYLIVDEAVQLQSINAKQLEYIKNTFNVSLIGLSDRYQCTVEKVDNKPLITTKFADKLFDCNVIELKKHKNMRYDEELYNHLMFIIDNWDNREKVIKHIKKNFNIVKKTKTEINIAYTNKKCDEIEDCITVHCVQGKTISKPYTIHELEKSPMDVIFTAISRAKITEQISIIL